MSHSFKLHLYREGESPKIAIYDPYNSTMTWEENGQSIIPVENEKAQDAVWAVSPENPGSKVKALRKIKIQLGFACNYTCNYCSQNNQRNFASDTAKRTLEKAHGFLEKIPTWFDGGDDGQGAGVQLEFWGGETLLYWSAVEFLATHLREKYPNIGLALFTNGSLVQKSMADFAKEKRLHFIVSHDGPTFNEDRAKDPFDIPNQRENLLYLYEVLSKENLISFNATVSPKNPSLIAIRKYIANKLGVEPKKVYVTYDLATPYDQFGLDYVTKPEKRRDLINGLFNEMKSYYPFDLSLGMTNIFLHDFYESLKKKRQATAVGQKCSMDMPSSIAVDIDGNVLTCQNVNAKGGHKIGHIDQLEEVKLNTAFHWSTRKECVSCPVVQICKGSCMFLENELWSAACNQHYTWGLSYLAVAIYLQSGYRLVKITGENLRNLGDREIDLLYEGN